MTVSSDRLPIEAIRSDFESALARRRVVVSSPTGSGKSTQIPRWCAQHGPVLVIEPRRVACRSLALRVAELEATELGGRVGYSVRDDHRATSRTELLFATPGVVLRMMIDSNLEPFETIIVDEFHERSMDVDLILALLLARDIAQGLIVMSATIDGERVARHLEGTHLEAQGRTFEVERRYVPTANLLPGERGLEARLQTALDASASIPGDILVFLPGKAEIGRAAAALRQRRDLEILPLHGGLTLKQQGQVFARGTTRRVILATNVAETSLTIPGIGVVIDSGLVRRTAYHNGRGYLTLAPIALDSADQRAGRAGRTGPGVCFRLWSRQARLAPRTRPEVHRESLVLLVLAASACGAPDPGALPFLDPPKPFALEAARNELEALSAIGEDGRVTERGRKLFGLPLDANLGSLLLAAQSRGCLADAIDLASVLAVGRPLYRGGPPDPSIEEDLREGGCDVVAHIRALRQGRPSRNRLDVHTLEEARSVSARLRRAFGLPGRTDSPAPIDRRSLGLAILESDPRCAHVPRRRREHTAWSNGSVEIELSRDSAVNLVQPVAIAVLATHAIGLGHRDRKVFATCAMPVPIPWLLEVGLGRDRLGGLSVANGEIVATVERVYAKRVLATREEIPVGRLAREAITTLFMERRLFREARDITEDRLTAWALFSRLKRLGGLERHYDITGQLREAQVPWNEQVPDLETWTRDRLESLGVEHGRDLALLSSEDLLPPGLPEQVGRFLDQKFPRKLSLGDAVYEVRYDLKRREVTLEKVRGTRKERPSLNLLPTFRGFRIILAERGRVQVIRDKNS